MESIGLFRWTQIYTHVMCDRRIFAYIDTVVTGGFFVFPFLWFVPDIPHHRRNLLNGW
jgi:hypothetical protein